MKTPSGPDGRLAAFGNQLIEVHLWLREELDLLRENVAAYLDDRGDRPRPLAAHCLSFCSALHRHHTGEDDVAFPAVAEQFPELRPVLDELRRDHQIVADAMRDLETLIGGLTPERAADPIEARRVRTDLDSLAALMETHFVYEEKRIVEALNALDAPAWDGTPPEFLKTDEG